MDTPEVNQLQSTEESTETALCPVEANAEDTSVSELQTAIEADESTEEVGEMHDTESRNDTQTECNESETDNLTENKRIPAIVMLGTACIALAVCVFSSINYIMSCTPNIMLSVNGREIGFVNDLSLVGSSRNSIESSISDAIGCRYKLDFDVSYTIKLTEGAVEYVGYDTVYDLLSGSCEDMVCDAFSLYADGVYVASAESEAVLNEAIEAVRAYCTEYETARNPSAESVTVTTDFRIVPDSRTRSVLMSAEKIAGLFKAPSVRNETVTLTTRDDANVLTSTSASSLSGALSTTAETEISKDSIRLSFTAPENTDVDYGFTRAASHSAEKGSTDLFSLLSYDVVSYETYTEIVPYTIEHVKSPYYYDGLTFKSAEGSDGIIENVYEVVTRDGKVISSTLHATNIISEMQPETYTIGTKEPPPAEATGTFLWPLQNDFMISSVYGLYRGKFDGDGFHYGLDLTGEIGDYIFAADGGEVIYAGKRSTYGIVVMIQHDTHLKTYYAHMNQAFVKTGDKVYPGQLIGEIGMTGLTTGPHLHFEIRKDSYPVDPMDYMPEH